MISGLFISKFILSFVITLYDWLFHYYNEPSYSQFFKPNFINNININFADLFW